MKRAFAEALENRLMLAVAPLDNGFGQFGVVTASFDGHFNNAHALAVQADGKVIIAGDADVNSKEIMAAIRYNADGTLDDGGPNDSTPGDHFGTGGIFTYAPGVASSITSIAIQKDGKIILAGTESVSAPVAQQLWMIVRLKTDGTFDNTYSGDGKSGEAFSVSNTPLSAIALQRDGKLVAVGSLNGNFLVGRFTTAGDIDDTFGANGSVTTDLGGTDSATGVAIDNIGNIIVVGGAGGNGSNQGIGIVRYQTDGSLDPNFATAGKKVVETGEVREVGNVVIKPDGKFDVATSHFFTAGGLAEWLGEDQSFSTTGSLASSGQTIHTHLNAVALMPNGAVIKGGSYLGQNQTRNDAFIVSDNISFTSVLGDTHTSVDAIAVAADGSIYTAGYQDGNNSRDFLLMKFVGIDPATFGNISGNVFRDTDGDHVHDLNEKGAANVRVFLDDDKDGKLTHTQFGDEQSVLTDANGNYFFPGISPRNVSVRIVLPSGTTQQSPAGAYAITIVGGKTFTGKHFVIQPLAVASTATAITGSVFNDYNNNGKREVTGAIEPDVANVTVFIDKNKNGKLDTKETRTKTDVSGNYKINLSAAGTYRVAMVPPTGYTNTTVKYYDLTVHTGKQLTAEFAVTPNDANDSIADANSHSAAKLNKTFSDTIASSTDVNMVRFTVKARQTVTFDLDLASGSSLNSYLRLFDSKGTQLSANDNAAASGESTSVDSYIKYKFTKAGTYYIAVSDHLNKTYNPLTGKSDIGGGTFGKYSLSIATA